MHGVKRVRQSPEALAAKKEKEQAKLNSYLELTQTVLAKKKSKDWSGEAFDLTTKLLQVNPEFYTVWNYRRDILLNGTFPRSSPQEINDILSSELHITTTALKQHPKVYWIWNHRRWCLASIPDVPQPAAVDEQEQGQASTEPAEVDPRGWQKAAWDREMYIVEKMLDADPRNFHAWNYRRYILSESPTPRPLSAELAYTTKKIESNFSNFSAWHQRSKVYAQMWESGEADVEGSKEAEFDLVLNAMYTDPDDQSVWVYHRWLVGKTPSLALLQREIKAIQELLDEQPDSKWCMESLVHYKQLLLQRHRSEVNSKEVIGDCSRLLRELRSVDPDRRARYAELEEKLLAAFA